jgi:hypothetical protein
MVIVHRYVFVAFAVLCATHVRPQSVSYLRSAASRRLQQLRESAPTSVPIRVLNFTRLPEQSTDQSVPEDTLQGRINVTESTEPDQYGAWYLGPEQVAQLNHTISTELVRFRLDIRGLRVGCHSRSVRCERCSSQLAFKMPVQRYQNTGTCVFPGESVYFLPWGPSRVVARNTSTTPLGMRREMTGWTFTRLIRAKIAAPVQHFMCRCRFQPPKRPTCSHSSFQGDRFLGPRTLAEGQPKRIPAIFAPFYANTLFQLAARQTPPGTTLHFANMALLVANATFESLESSGVMDYFKFGTASRVCISDRCASESGVHCRLLCRCTVKCCQLSRPVSLLM